MANAPKHRADKKRIEDDVWTDEHIRSFLSTEKPSQSGVAVAGERDFFRLLRAYQSMRVHDFQRFCEFFAADGGDFLAKGTNGQTIASYISSHRYATPYIEIIESHAKQSSSS